MRLSRASVALLSPLSAILLMIPFVGAGHAAAQTAARDTAIFAGGCFWCMEPPYDKLDGVTATISGYAGGHVPNPSYEQVTAGGTGHREAVQIIYDPGRVSYETLLDVFWVNVDPLDDGGQFCDRGFSYTTAIFARDGEQARLARESKEAVQEELEEPVVTPVVTGADFYPAEDYHQNYYREHSIRYRYYRWACGRDNRLEELWGQGPAPDASPRTGDAAVSRGPASG